MASGRCVGQRPDDHTLHTTAEPTARLAVKILVSKRNYTITAFSSQLTKKTVHKFLWPLLVVNLSIPGLI